MEDIFAKIGIKSAHLFAGFIGGVFVMYFGKRPTSIREKIRAFITVILSAVCTGYLTPLIISWQPDWESVEHGLAFLVGLFGMGVLHGFFNLVTAFTYDPIGVVKNIRNAIRG